MENLSTIRSKKRYPCECGGSYTFYSEKTHLKGNKHTTYLQIQENIKDYNENVKRDGFPDFSTYRTLWGEWRMDKGYHEFVNGEKRPCRKKYHFIMDFDDSLEIYYKYKNMTDNPYKKLLTPSRAKKLNEEELVEYRTYIQVYLLYSKCEKQIQHHLMNY